MTRNITLLKIGESEIIKTSLFDQVENVTPMTKKDGSNA